MSIIAKRTLHSQYSNESYIFFHIFFSLQLQKLCPIHRKLLSSFSSVVDKHFAGISEEKEVSKEYVKSVITSRKLTGI